MIVLLLAAALLTDREEITSRLMSWPAAFNARELEKSCALFAPDLIATYPGAPDRSYNEMCRHFEKLFSGETAYRYQLPKIEEILIDRDVAVVRLIWTLTDGAKTVKERGLDVFKRQSDGSWKIAISYAYPEPS